MRPITRTTLCAFAAAAMAAPAFAASDYYLKIGDVKSKSASEQIEIASYSFGATQAGSFQTLKGSKIGENAGASQSSGIATTAGGVRVAAGDVNADGKADVITSPRDASSGLPTGKRQHKPLTVTKPLDRGSVTVNAGMTGCTVGAAYPGAVLQTAAARYEFTDVFITSCTMPGMSSGGGNVQPMESISFNYAKIETVYAPRSKEKKK